MNANSQDSIPGQLNQLLNEKLLLDLVFYQFAYRCMAVGKGC
jgi:hypothetical protein